MIPEPEPAPWIDPDDHTCFDAYDAQGAVSATPAIPTCEFALLPGQAPPADEVLCATLSMDQLQDVNAEQKLKTSIMEACIFGSGAVKAGTVRIDRKKSYSKQMDPTTGQTAFALTEIEQPAPELESVSIFDLYPDPYCTSLDDCDGF